MKWPKTVATIQRFMNLDIKLNDLSRRQNFPIELIERADEPLTLIDISNLPKNVLVSAHVYYPEFAPYLRDRLADMPMDWKLAVTTPSNQIAEALLAKGYFGQRNVEIVVTPNRGRNFAPLLVEFGDSVSNFDYLIHVHSKKSSHTKARIVENWVRAVQEPLLESHKIYRLIQELERDSETVIGYGSTEGIIRMANFSWGLNQKHLKRKFPEINFDFKKHRRFTFPAGGMFVLKVKFYTSLFEARFSYEDFAVESGQVDGTLHHAIERFFGWLPLTRGKKQLLYFNDRDQIGKC